MPFRLTIEEIETMMKIEKSGTTFSVRLKGGQMVFGKNFFYLAELMQDSWDQTKDSKLFLDTFKRRI